MTRCLILQYDWDGREALEAGRVYQASLDSIAARIAELARDREREKERRNAACVDRARRDHKPRATIQALIDAGAPYEHGTVRRYLWLDSMAAVRDRYDSALTAALAACTY